MGEKVSKKYTIPAITMVMFVLIMTLVLPNIKGTRAASTNYPSDEVVENFVGAMIYEIGCGGTNSEETAKSQFVYQMIWVNTVVNQYNFWFESRRTPSTVVFDMNTLCKIFSRGGKGGSYNPYYCGLTIESVEKKQGYCKSY